MKQNLQAGLKKAKARRDKVEEIVSPVVLFKPPLTEQRGLQAEPKYFDTSNTVAVTWNQAAIDITQPTQGSGVTSRVGDEIAVNSIELGIRAYAGAGAAPALRVVLFKWNIDSNLGTPGPGEVLQPGGGTVVTAVSALNLLRVRAGEIEVVYDAVVPLCPLTVDRPASFRKMFPVSSRVRFNAAGITGVGKFYLFFCSQAAATDCSVDYYARINYVD